MDVAAAVSAAGLSFYGATFADTFSIATTDSSTGFDYLQIDGRGGADSYVVAGTT